MKIYFTDLALIMQHMTKNKTKGLHNHSYNWIVRIFQSGYFIEWFVHLWACKINSLDNEPRTSHLQTQPNEPVSIMVNVVNSIFKHEAIFKLGNQKQRVKWVI